MKKSPTSLNNAVRNVSASLDSVTDRFGALMRKLERAEGAREQIEASIQTAKRRADDARHDYEVIDRVLQLLHAMEESWQRAFQQSVANIISEGLSYVFGEELEVKITPTTKGDVSALEFTLYKDGVEEDIVEGQGGGYINVLAFLLRVLLIVASRPPLRRIIIMDEPFAMVSQEYRAPLAELVRALVDRLDFQIVMVTHEPEYAEVADVLHRFQRNGRIKTTVQGVAESDED